MRVLLFLLPMLTGFLMGYVAAATARRVASKRAALNKSERAELEARRRGDDALMADCLNSKDVEPYARIVYDRLSNTQREIASS